jgi:hypothetical protein
LTAAEAERVVERLKAFDIEEVCGRSVYFRGFSAL